MIASFARRNTPERRKSFALSENPRPRPPLSRCLRFVAHLAKQIAKFVSENDGIRLMILSKCVRQQDALRDKHRASELLEVLIG